jgi:hypothetical protein
MPSISLYRLRLKTADTRIKSGHDDLLHQPNSGVPGTKASNAAQNCAR